jgi:uncharacterized protein (TIGR02217 family)
MGNAVFPTFPGLTWNVTKTPQWSTRVQRVASGRELRASLFTRPLWGIKLSYEVLRANGLQELQQLVGFFNARQGSFDSFLYADPDDSSVTQALFGTGDGSAKQFQLLRSFGGFSEPVVALQGVPTIFVNGAQSAGATADLNSGIVTFAAAPAAGAALTWSGSFYWRVRFAKDSIEFNQFMKQLWEAKTVELISVK